MARNGLRALAHLAPHLPALAALDLAGNRLSDDGELKFLAALPALASISLADTALSRKQERSVCLTSTPIGRLSRRKRLGKIACFHDACQSCTLACAKYH